MIIAGEFPAPMKLGNRNRWKQSVVYKWVEELQATTKKMAERTSVWQYYFNLSMKAFNKIQSFDVNELWTIKDFLPILR